MEQTQGEEEKSEVSFTQTSKRKKNKINNKRRFSDEQIRLLESNFESDTKLEPRMKLQLARELQLQPRQVAIWFQNRRARWKSKQIEHDYKILRSNYDSLATRFESLKKEKDSLLAEVISILLFIYLSFRIGKQWPLTMQETMKEFCNICVRIHCSFDFKFYYSKYILVGVYKIFNQFHLNIFK